MSRALERPFDQRMLQVLNDAFVALLCSVGHRTGLFDVMDSLPPSTSEELARAAGLEERYVREWLGGMVTGGVVDYDPEERRYSLPRERSAFLTRAAGNANLARFCQYVGLAGTVEKEIVHCFRAGGGVSYSAYPEFQAIQAEDSGPLFDAELVSSILPLVPEIIPRLRRGIDVVDLACGQGHALNVMAAAFPRSRFLGLDLSEEGLAAGRREAEARGLKNVHFERHDAAARMPGPVDLVTCFDAIHDLPRPKQALLRIAEALRAQGAFLMMDMAGSSRLEENLAHPVGPFLYAISLFHCLTVSLAARGDGLGTMWGEQRAEVYLREAGFRSVAVHHPDDDPVHVYYVATV